MNHGRQTAPDSRDGDSLAKVRALARFRASSAGGLFLIYLYMGPTVRRMV